MPSAEEQLGALIAREVARQVKTALESKVLACSAQVATTAVLGVSPVRNMTGPNGDTISEAAVWIMVDTPTAQNTIWCPVRRGVTLTGGEVVRVVRNSPNSTWWVDAKL